MKAKTRLFLMAVCFVALPVVAADFTVIPSAPEGVDMPELLNADFYAAFTGSGARRGVLPNVGKQAVVIAVPRSAMEDGKKYELTVGVRRQRRFPFEGELVMAFDSKTTDTILQLNLQSLDLHVRHFRLLGSDGSPIPNQPLALMEVRTEGSIGVAAVTTDKNGEFQLETWGDRQYEIASSPGGSVGLFKRIGLPKQPEGRGVVEVQFVRSHVGAIGALEMLEQGKPRRAVEYSDKVFISGDDGKAVWVRNVDDGEFGLPKLPPGDYRIGLSPDSEYTVVRGGAMTVSQKQPLRDVSLLIARREKGQHTLRVKSNKGTPLRAASVIVMTGGSVLAQEDTDAEGQVAFKLHEGSYVVRVNHPGFTRLTKNVEFQEEGSLDLVLNEQVSAKFLVTDPTGAPVAESLVVVVQRVGGQRTERSGRTDAAGLATITGLDAGDAIASVLKAGVPRIFKKSRIEGNEVVRFPLTAGSKVSGRVLLGELVGKASKIIFLEPEGGLVAGGGELDEHGQFTALMADGTYDAYVPFDRNLIPVGSLTVKGSRNDIQYTVNQAAMDAAMSNEQVFKNYDR